jgi:hypothetical protein
MTPLRAKYIQDLVIRGRSENTQEAYTRYVRDLARYYRRSPELISYEEVTDWVYRSCAPGTSDRVSMRAIVSISSTPNCVIFQVALV